MGRGARGRPFAVVVWCCRVGEYLAHLSRHDTYNEAERAAARAHSRHYGGRYPSPRGYRFIPVNVERFEDEYGNLPEEWEL